MESVRTFLSWWKTDTFVKVGATLIALGCSWFVLELIIAATASPMMQFWSGIALACLWYGASVWYSAKPRVALRWRVAGYTTVMGTMLWLQHAYELLNPWFVSVVAVVVSARLWQRAFAERSLYAYAVMLLGVMSIPAAVFGGVVPFMVAILWCVVVWILGMSAAVRSALYELFDYVSVVTLVVLLLCGFFYDVSWGVSYLTFICFGVVYVWWGTVLARMLTRGRKPMASWPYLGAFGGLLLLGVVYWGTLLAAVVLAAVFIAALLSLIFMSKDRVTPLFIGITLTQFCVALYTLLFWFVPAPWLFGVLLLFSLVSIVYIVRYLKTQPIGMGLMLLAWLIPLSALLQHVPSITTLSAAYAVALAVSIAFIFKRYQWYQRMHFIVLTLVVYGLSVHLIEHYLTLPWDWYFIAVSALSVAMVMAARTITMPRVYTMLLVTVGLLALGAAVVRWVYVWVSGGVFDVLALSVVVVWLCWFVYSFFTNDARVLIRRTLLLLMICIDVLILFSLVPFVIAVVALSPLLAGYAYVLFRYAGWFEILTYRVFISAVLLLGALMLMLWSAFFIEGNASVFVSIVASAVIAALFYSREGMLVLAATRRGALTPTILYSALIGMLWTGLLYGVGATSVYMLGYAMTPYVLIVTAAGVAYALILYGRFTKDYVLVGVSSFILLITMLRTLSVETWQLPDSLQLVPFLLAGIIILSLSMRRFGGSDR